MVADWQYQDVFCSFSTDFRSCWIVQVAPRRPPYFLDSLRSPFGPAFGCYSAALRLLVQSKVSKRNTPLHPGRAAHDFPHCGTVPMAPMLQRGSLACRRWSVEGCIPTPERGNDQRRAWERSKCPDGPRMALRGVPAERHRSEGARSAAQGRMMGQAFLLTFAATPGKSDTPGRAEQSYQPSVATAASKRAKGHGLPIRNPSTTPAETVLSPPPHTPRQTPPASAGACRWTSRCRQRW